MSEGSSETKKHKPSLSKLKKLKKKGDFSQSKEYPVLVGLIRFYFFVSIFIHLIIEDWGLFFSNMIMTSELTYTVEYLLYFLLKVVAMVCLVTLVTFVFSWVIHGKTTISVKKVELKIASLSPLSGIKNMVGKVAIVTVVRKTLILLLFFFTIMYFISLLSDYYSFFYTVSSAELLFIRFTFLFNSLMLIVMILAVSLTVVDYTCEFNMFVSKNMMTDTELKDEFKQLEGSPEIKGKRRSAMLELFHSPAGKKQKPNFGLANPTEIFVQLYYGPDVPCPIYLSSCEGENAKITKQEFLELGIPIVEYKPLARAIFNRSLSENDLIPTDLFGMIAPIVGDLMKNGQIKY